MSPYPTPPGTPPLLAGPSTPEERLLWFDAGKYETPGHDSLIQNMTRMIDLALVHPDDDPFVSGSDTEPQTPFMQTLSTLSMNTPTAGMKEHQLVFSPIKPIVSTTGPAKRDPLMPSPLQIRKKSDGLTEAGPKCADDCEPQKKATTRPRPPPLPLKIIPANELNIRSQKTHATANLLQGKGAVSCVIETPSLTPSHETNNNEDNTMDVNPARAAQIVRFNRGIEFLREQVKSNITEIQQHVDHVEEIQRARRSRKMQRAVSFWSFSPIKVEEGAEEKQTQEPVMDQFGNILVKETKPQRISRLRAEGWNTVGLRSPRSTWKGARYYQEFCNMVLNELCLDN